MDLSRHKQVFFVKKRWFGLAVWLLFQVGSTACPGAVSSVCVEQERTGRAFWVRGSLQDKFLRTSLFFPPHYSYWKAGMVINLFPAWTCQGYFMMPTCSPCSAVLNSSFPFFYFFFPQICVSKRSLSVPSQLLFCRAEQVSLHFNLLN